jgi:hypothetical protein
VCISCLSHVCYMPCPFPLPWLDRFNNIWWSVQVMKFLSMQSSPAACHFLLGSNILLSTLFSNIVSLCSSLWARDQVSHPYKEKVKAWFFIF